MWNLHIREYGSPQNPTIVFLHGFPFNSSMWEPQIQHLSANYHILAYDHRGHGLSGLGTGHYTVEFFVDDLLDVVTSKNISNAFICGLSMGGYIALRAMEKFPERFRGLILADTRSETDTNEARLKRAANIKIVEEKGVSDFCEGFLKAILTPDTLQKNPVVTDKVRKMIMTTPPTAIMGTLLALAGRTDTTASLSKITVPTLILVGEKDAVTPPDAAKAMHEKIAGSKLVTIPHAGHVSNLENPEAFNQALLVFLNSAV